MDPSAEPRVEKEHIDRLEHGSVRSHAVSHHSGLEAHGFAADADELPKGYFTSKNFMGTMLAVSQVCSYKWQIDHTDAYR
jgi:hypothetical protein